MTHTGSPSGLALGTRIVVPVAIAAAAVALAGPAHAVPIADAQTSTSAEAGHTSDCAADIAALRANLDRLYGHDYVATIRCDGALGITVQRGSFAGRVTEY
jgi:hypothetical protein